MYKIKYLQYKSKYEFLKEIIIHKNNSLIPKEWPVLFESCNFQNKYDSDSDICIRELENSRKDPFYETDLVNGFTNNGFHDGWLPNYNSLNKNIRYVTVYTSVDIQKAIRKYLKSSIEKKSIIVKNTGHDYIGRSCPNQNDCLVLWTHKMTNLVWINNQSLEKLEKPEKLDRVQRINSENPTKINIPKIRRIVSDVGNLKYQQLDSKHIKDYSKIAPLGYCTVDAGVQWYKIFDFMLKEVGDDNNIDIWAMKGASNTVGAAGGWLLDGGFGLFSKLYGMGIDNVISMEVILADGSINQISETENSELFHAFRGSGACNFGILSKVTYKLLEALTSFGDIFIHFDCSKMDDTIYIQLLNILLNSGFMTDAFFGGTIQIYRDKIDCFIQYGNITFDNIIINYIDQFINSIHNFFNERITRIYSDNTLDKNTFDFTKGLKSHYIIVNQQINTTMNGSKYETISKKRWWTYESYNDYIVAFGSSYLLYDDVIKDDYYCANIFLQILQYSNMIQIEISKGLYGASSEILETNRKSYVNPKVRRALGLVYIRSYLINFKPDVRQSYDVLKTVEFKYEKNNSLKDAIINLDFQLSNQQITNDQKIDEMHKLIIKHADISKKKVYEGIKILQENIGNNSTYINHSDYNEHNWERRFYGDKNFKKLVELKQRYDPNDLFKHKFSIPLTVPKYMLDDPEEDIFY